MHDTTFRLRAESREVPKRDFPFFLRFCAGNFARAAKKNTFVREGYAIRLAK